MSFKIPIDSKAPSVPLEANTGMWYLEANTRRPLMWSLCSCVMRMPCTESGSIPQRCMTVVTCLQLRPISTKMPEDFEPI